MRFLITAGNTQTPIDRVRCITNIFSGKTGASLALEAYRQGHIVMLLTSHAEAIRELPNCPATFDEKRWSVWSFRTFDDLARLMESQIPGKPVDVIIHCAAVSDYAVAGIFAPASGTTFHDGAWQGEPAKMVDRQRGKVKSDEPELWIRLTRTPKLIDRIRSDWGFAGTLVKFKLEVGLSDEELILIAEASRRQSGAEWMVANTLEGMRDCAFVGPTPHGYERVPRRDLASRLLQVLTTPR